MVVAAGARAVEAVAQVHPRGDGARGTYMLNTRNEETITVFYSYVACFVNRSWSSLPEPSPSRRWPRCIPDGTERDEPIHVEYAERGNYNGILFIFSLLCEYIQLEYVRIHVIYRVN